MKRKGDKREEEKEPFLSNELIQEIIHLIVKIIGERVKSKVLKAILVGTVAAAGNFYSVDDPALLDRARPDVNVNRPADVQ